MKSVTALMLLLMCSVLAQIQTYHGTIGEYPITMSLEIDTVSDNITGTYFYTKYKKEIALSGHCEGESISLFVYDSEGYIIETFSAIMSKTAITGSWNHEKRTLPLSLKSDPWNDNRITAEELRSQSDLVFAKGSPDLGSGWGSSNKVDYRCEGSIFSLEFMKPVLSNVETIRNQTDRRCSGSIMYAQYRYYAFSLLKAMFAPDLFAQQQEKTRARYIKHHEDYYHAQRTYFNYWGCSQLTNYTPYMDFIKEEDGGAKKLFGYDDSAAVDLLAAHFKKRYPAKANMATIYAENIFAFLLDRAVGGAPYLTYIEAPRLTPLELKLATRGPIIGLDSQLEEPMSSEVLNRALRKAVLWGRSTEVLEALINKGADLNSGYESPLFFALKSQLGTVEFLIDKGAEVDYQNSFGKTPLFYAVGFSDTALAKLLIKKGASVNATYYSKAKLDSIEYADKKPVYISFCPLRHTKRSVLMHAAQNSNVGMLTLLLDSGSKLHAVDELGYNAADYAKMEGKSENLAYLKKRGLQPAK